MLSSGDMLQGGRIESYIDALPLKTSDLQRLDVLEHLVTSVGLGFRAVARSLLISSET